MGTRTIVLLLAAMVLLTSAPFPLFAADDLLAERGTTPGTVTVTVVAAVTAVLCVLGGVSAARVALRGRRRTA
jgi:hypothetical protein